MVVWPGAIGAELHVATQAGLADPPPPNDAAVPCAAAPPLTRHAASSAANATGTRVFHPPRESLRAPFPDSSMAVSSCLCAGESAKCLRPGVEPLWRNCMGPVRNGDNVPDAAARKTFRAACAAGA